MFVKKWPLEYQMVTNTYLLSNLCDSSDTSDTSDSCDSSDSSDSADSSMFSSDLKTFCTNNTKKNFFLNKFYLKKTFLLTTKNLNCEWTFKNQIVMKLQKSNYDQAQKLNLW